MFDALTLVEKATRIATIAHEGQVRKNDGSPYIVHPYMCALNLMKHGFSEEVVAAALTHDVLEDTELTIDTLLDELGEDVVAIVKTVSEDKTLEWEDRKDEYIESVRAGSEDAKAVCIADKIHNAQSVIHAHSVEGEEIWKVFSREKEKKLLFEESCLAMFKETWEHPLVNEYEELVKTLRSLN